jgi:DNA-binding NarL/FixJ family response regulator
MPGPPQIRIMCVDDHPVVREGLTRRIAIESDMTVVAAAPSGEEALKLFEAHRPDVTLMDLNLPGMSGVETISALRRRDPEARIIVLTMYDGDDDIHRALTVGAAAYVLKTTVSDDLIDVIRKVHAGARPMSADVAAQLSARAVSPSVTAREKEVLQLMATGMRNKEIAAALVITEDTVEVHAKKIFMKLKVQDRTAAVTVALRRGIIHLR